MASAAGPVFAYSCQDPLGPAKETIVLGGKADGAFFSQVKKGIDDARLVVQAHGGTVKFVLQNCDNIGSDARRCCTPNT